MNGIAFGDRQSDILSFFAEKRIDIPEKVKTPLLSLLSNICSYEEEENRIFPYIMLGMNIETDVFASMFSVEAIKIIVDNDAGNFSRLVKPLIPFCNNGWCIYVDLSFSQVHYGILRNFAGIGSLSIEEAFRGNKAVDTTQLYTEYGISAVMTFPLNKKCFSLLALDGEEVRVDFSLCQSDYDDNSLNMFISDVTMNNTSMQNVFRRVTSLFPQKLHGSICLVVKNGCELPNELLKDGIFLKDGIDLFSSARELQLIGHSTDNNYVQTLVNKHYALTGLFYEMLNCDGITIIDTDGVIRGYNVFISSSNEEKTIIGGARKRAALTLINSGDLDFLGVYFQSQDGNYFYKRIKNE